MFLCAPLWENKSEGRTHSVNLSLAGQKATRTGTECWSRRNRVTGHFILKVWPIIMQIFGDGHSQKARQKACLLLEQFKSTLIGILKLTASEIKLQQQTTIWALKLQISQYPRGRKGRPKVGEKSRSSPCPSLCFSPCLILVILAYFNFHPPKPNPCLKFYRTSLA